MEKAPKRACAASCFSAQASLAQGGGRKPSSVLVPHRGPSNGPCTFLGILITVVFSCHQPSPLPSHIATATKSAGGSRNSCRKLILALPTAAEKPPRRRYCCPSSSLSAGAYGSGTGTARLATLPAQLPTTAPLLPACPSPPTTAVRRLQPSVSALEGQRTLSEPLRQPFSSRKTLSLGSTQNEQKPLPRWDAPSGRAGGLDLLIPPAPLAIPALLSLSYPAAQPHHVL